MTTKRFHLGDLVTVATGRLVSPNYIDGVYSVVDHVTGEQHLAPQLARAMATVTPWLIEQHPWLTGITVPDWVSDEASVYSWLEQTVAEYGEFHHVEQMPFGSYVGREPIAELHEMAPHVGIIQVEMPAGAAHTEETT